ncbi:hypothetical protein So717_11760 [Roseobacter cerasinus]|uniref:Holin-X, holin superfamily III n=1 Tax=Roseobacter cerasinus TaxID=2602289 RepID=A0A640VMF5_9RHOB|nr:phage holin family protein [Roseobacter cerasinus]GFE49423.1 hypothetical protein So717_11760 [Roseobacter cerasinus]
MLARLQHAARDAAQRFALGGVGALMGLAGVGFLSAAALLFLLTQTDPITACAIMGAGFLGLGLLLMVIARPSRHKPAKRDVHTRPAPREQDMPPIAAAFMQGMAEGMAHNRRH